MRRMTRARAASVGLALVMTAAGALPAGAAPGGEPGPPERKRHIVVLADSADSRGVAAEHSRNHGAAVAFVYEHALRGYAADLSDGEMGAVRRDPRVRSVEPDQEVGLATTQTGATWGLDRIDQRNLPLSKTFGYTRIGVGVTAYILDTGIRTGHSDFGGRASIGRDVVGGSNANGDCHGHGTHVAGTVGGGTYGVAKGVKLVGVRVLGCGGSGSLSGVIAGVDWVTGNHTADAPAVANMSLGAGVSTALDTAVRNSIQDGVTYALAAGNGNILGIAQDACRTSPARVTEAITVGATDATDKKASWSNFGACVDWFAPGVSIVSASNTSSTGTKTMSGTSMAAPHVAGVAALYLEGKTGTALLPAAVRTALYDLTTKGVVASARTATNHLLYTNL
jgi:subtilisin family serine protease